MLNHCEIIQVEDERHQPAKDSFSRGRQTENHIENFYVPVEPIDKEFRLPAVEEM